MTSAARAKYLAYQTNNYKCVRNYENMGNIFVYSIEVYITMQRLRNQNL